MKMKASIKLLLLSAMILITYVSRSQNSVALKLTEKDRQVSEQFKTLNGQDRLTVFAKLQHLIRIKEANAVNATSDSKMMGANPSLISEVVSLLGNPTKKVGSTLYEYSLKSGKGKCKVVIAVDKLGYVAFCTIKDCN